MSFFRRILNPILGSAEAVLTPVFKAGVDTVAPALKAAAVQASIGRLRAKIAEERDPVRRLALTAMMDELLTQLDQALARK